MTESKTPRPKPRQAKRPRPGAPQAALAGETVEQRRARELELESWLADIAKRGPTTTDLELATLAAERPEAHRELAEKVKALEAALTAALGAARVVDDSHPYQGIVPSRTIVELLTWAAALLGQERATWSAAPPPGRSAKILKLESLRKQGFSHAQIARAGLAEGADQVRDQLRGCAKKRRQRARKKNKAPKRVHRKVSRTPE